MTLRNLFLSILLGPVLLAGSQAARADHGRDSCTGFITSVPAVISTQGTWCLKQDLSAANTSGSAIDIQANAVIIDCNGFRLIGGTNIWGISNSTNGANIKIRRCNIQNFSRGISLAGGSGHTIEDNRIDGCISLGIFINSNDSVVRRNWVFNTHAGNANSATGIFAEGSVDLLDNIVSGVTGSNVEGIEALGPASGRIAGNSVRGLTALQTFGEYIAIHAGADRVSIHDNDLVGDGSAGSIGIYGANDRSRVKRNTINGFATALRFCHDSGDNAIHP
jgi:hypothetical protein